MWLFQWHMQAEKQVSKKGDGDVPGKQVDKQIQAVSDLKAESFFLINITYCPMK